LLPTAPVNPDRSLLTLLASIFARVICTSLARCESVNARRPTLGDCGNADATITEAAAMKVTMAADPAASGLRAVAKCSSSEADSC
jgi:hypothetical protein